MPYLVRVGCVRRGRHGMWWCARHDLRHGFRGADRNIVNNSDSRLLVVETTDMRAKADGADKECPALEHIICFENGGLDRNHGLRLRRERRRA